MTIENFMKYKDICFFQYSMGKKYFKQNGK